MKKKVKIRIENVSAGKPKGENAATAFLTC